MIELIDGLIRHYLKQSSRLNDDNQIGFQPPDEQWRSKVSNLGDAVNVYLVDLRENRKLRSNERIRSYDNGTFVKEPAPARLDCHYLITAWSAAQPAPQVSPSLEEHQLLYEVIAILLESSPFNASQTYKNDAFKLSLWPKRFQNCDLPTLLLPADGFPKLSEFWQSMGQGARWKPCIYLVVTLPIALMKTIEDPPVTTRVTEYRQAGYPEPVEQWRHQIGGYIFDTTKPLVDGRSVGTINAWVGLETTESLPELLQVTHTNDLGQFTFTNLRIGNYQLRVRSPGLSEVVRPISVPSSEGHYDIHLT